MSTQFESDDQSRTDDLYGQSAFLLVMKLLNCMLDIYDTALLHSIEDYNSMRKVNCHKPEYSHVLT